MTFVDVLATEFVKLRRSKVTWITFAVYTFMAVMAGVFMWITLNPGSAQSLGLLGQKANLTLGNMPPNWATFQFLIVEIGGIGGLVLVSIIAIFVFGREYAEGTAKNMLALPIPRSYFVLAKTVVVATWFALLTLWLIPASCTAGWMAGLTGFSSDIISSVAAKLLELAAMSLCCGMLVAWVAAETRGYFAPFGFTIFTMMLGSIFGHTGWAPWVPWCVVGIASGAAGPDAKLAWGSYAVIAVTFVLGVALTIRHEALADNMQ